MFHLPPGRLPEVVPANGDEMEPSAFQLSRIYGQGWNAAKQWLAHHARDPNPKQAAKLNPHHALEERARWNKGFEEGLLSRTGGRAIANHRSWRPDGDSNRENSSRLDAWLVAKQRLV